MMEELALNQVFCDPLSQVSSSQTERDKKKHCGFISLPAHVLESLHIGLRNLNTQGELEDNGVFAEICSMLQLPQNYTIMALINRFTLDGTYNAWVVSPDLPLASDFNYPELKLTYQRLGDGTIRLHKIKIKDEWEKVYSDPSVCPTCGKGIDDAR